MTGYLDFLAHLSETPQSRDALVEASGLDAKTVSNRLTMLRKKTLIKRTGDGWVRTAAAPPQEDAVHADDPKPRKPRKAKKARGERKARRKRRAPQLAEPADHTLDYFVDIDGDVQIVRRDGEGDAAIVPRRDALRLAAFLQRVRPVLELDAEAA